MGFGVESAVLPPHPPPLGVQTLPRPCGSQKESPFPIPASERPQRPGLSNT